MTTKKVFIYALQDPDTKKVFYVGKATNMASRLRSHINEALRKEAQEKPTKKQKKIQGILEESKKPRIMMLEKVAETHWQRAERKWIASYRKKLGKELLNESRGGMYIPPHKKAAWLKKKNTRA